MSNVETLPGRGGFGRLAGRMATTVRLSLSKLSREPLGMLGFIVLAILVLVAIFAPLIAPYSPTAQNLPQALQPLYVDNRRTALSACVRTSPTCDGSAGPEG